MTDIIERLQQKRSRVHDLGGVGFEPDPDCIEAATEITSLRAQLEKMREALDLALSRGCSHCADSIHHARSLTAPSERPANPSTKDSVK